MPMPFGPVIRVLAAAWSAARPGALSELAMKTSALKELRGEFPHLSGDHR
jgi:hypothetical protein